VVRYIYRDGLPACKQSVTHPSTNPAWCRVTSLIRHNALPLRHATNPEHLDLEALILSVLLTQKCVWQQNIPSIETELLFYRH